MTYPSFPLFATQQILKNRISPSLIIDADNMDHRNFSAAQFETHADAFMEMLLEKKGLAYLTRN